MNNTTFKSIATNNTQEEKNMSKQEFAQAIAQNITGSETTTVEKANGVILTGITVPTGSNARPTVYIDQMYDDGMTVEDATDAVKKTADRHAVKDISIKWFDDFDQVAPRLRARLYNVATSADVFRIAPAPFNDLIIVPYVTGIRIEGEDAGAVKVKAEHLKMWNVTADQVLDIAEENSKADAKLQSMAEILSEMMGVTVPDDGSMWVVSNTRKMYGAYSVIALMDDLRAKFTDGFTVLPSSIHEVIVVPMNDQEMLTGIVQSVNSSEVGLEEQLSDHSYRIAA